MNYSDRFLSLLPRARNESNRDHDLLGFGTEQHFPLVHCLVFHLKVNNCSVLFPSAAAESPFVPPPRPPNRAPPPSSDLERSRIQSLELFLDIRKCSQPPSGQEILEICEEALLEGVEDLQADLLVLLLETVDLGLQSFVLLLHGAQLHAGGKIQHVYQGLLQCCVNPLNYYTYTFYN